MLSKPLRTWECQWPDVISLAGWRLGQSCHGCHSTFEEEDLIIQAEKLIGIDKTAERRRRTDGGNVMQGTNENVEDRNEFHIEQASLGFRRRGTSKVRGTAHRWRAFVSTRRAGNRTVG